ncbi:GyrI-like domain-containing protein, partial [Inconstantimicrobium porci]
GKYAKFVVRGHMQKAVQQFWQELWKMKLDRKYTADFEEYQDDCIDNAEIHIYIALK